MSRVRSYFHIVWATKQREQKIRPQDEHSLFRLAVRLTQDMGYNVLAINGMPDHVHLLIETGPQIDLSTLMKKVKGVTSMMMNEATNQEKSFRWQEGYFASTVTPAHVDKISEYIRRQKDHHREGKVYSAWEETGETSDISSVLVPNETSSIPD